MADHPSPCAKQPRVRRLRAGGCWPSASGSAANRFARAAARAAADDSSLVIAVDHNACILCDRCIRGCNEIRDNQVIGRMGKGYAARIAFDLDDADGRLDLRRLRRVHGLLPDRGADQPRVVEADPWKDVAPARSRSPPTSWPSTRCSRASRTPFLRLERGVRGPAAASRRARSSAARGSSARRPSSSRRARSRSSSRRRSQARQRSRRPRRLRACSSGSPAAWSARGEDQRDEESASRYIHDRRPGRRCATTTRWPRWRPATSSAR